MTLKYKLFNIPGNLEEFLSKEKKSGNKEVILESYIREDLSVFISLVDSIVIRSAANPAREFQISEYATYSGLSPDFAENSSKVRAKMLNDREELIKKIQGYGFSVDYP